MKVAKPKKIVVSKNVYQTQPGTIYVLQAKGFHGIFPGLFLKRYKIGFSRDFEQRLEILNSNQMPCDLQVVHTFKVKNVECAEAELHRCFQKNNVKMYKSREWFDFNPVELDLVLKKMKYYETRSPYALTSVRKSQPSTFVLYMRRIFVMLVMLVVTGSLSMFAYKFMTYPQEPSFEEPPVQAQ